MFPQKVRSVHFGDAEDILSTSFLREEDAQDPPSEEKRRTEEICHRLQLALKTDDVSMLKHLMVEVPDLAEKYMDKPVLHLAAEYGALKISQEFVSKPSDSINSATSDYEASTPLYWAIRNGHRDVANWLLSNGAFHQPLNVFQDTAVYVAVQYEQYDILNVLKDYNCDFDMANSNNDLPIKYVIRKGDVTGLDKLLQCGADVYAKKNEIVMNLAIQTSEGVKIIPRLIEAGYDVNQSTYAPLRNAVYYNNTEAIQILLPHTTNPDIVSKAANLAISHCCLTNLKIIMQANPEVDVNLALRADRMHILRYLLGRGTRLDTKPVLYWCVYYCSLSTRSTSVVPCTRWNFTHAVPRAQKIQELHEAHLKMVQMLLDCRADLDDQLSETGSTALRNCATGGLVCLTLLLLKAGCNPSIPDNSGSTALTFALRDCSNLYVSTKQRYLLSIIASILLEFIPYFSKEPSLMEFIAERDSTAANSHQPLVMPKDVYEALQYNQSTPKTLQHLCRYLIIHTMKPNPHMKVKALPLPHRLKGYLLLEDLAEISKNNNFNHYIPAGNPCYIHGNENSENEQTYSYSGAMCACDPKGVSFTCRESH